MTEITWYETTIRNYLYGAEHNFQWNSDHQPGVMQTRALQELRIAIHFLNLGYGLDDKITHALMEKHGLPEGLYKYSVKVFKNGEEIL